MSRYDDLVRETLIRLPQRRDAERQPGPVRGRDEIERRLGRAPEDAQPL